MMDNKKTTRNLVAKHARTFNKAGPHADRKKAARRGKVKHKGSQYEV